MILFFSHRNNVFEWIGKARLERRILYRSVKLFAVKFLFLPFSSCFSDPVLFPHILKWYEDHKKERISTPLRICSEMALPLSEEAQFFAIPHVFVLPPKKAWIAALCFQVLREE